jgi:hypothetical protein
MKIIKAILPFIIAPIVPAIYLYNDYRPTIIINADQNNISIHNESSFKLSNVRLFLGIEKMSSPDGSILENTIAGPYPIGDIERGGEEERITKDIQEILNRIRSVYKWEGGNVCILVSYDYPLPFSIIYEDETYRGFNFKSYYEWNKNFINCSKETTDRLTDFSSWSKKNPRDFLVYIGNAKLRM